ncbi:MAG: helix-turn-helix transcriptional regulator [Acidaminobacteraceae bacterium]
MNVAERITYLRTQKGYTVNKLANLSGLSQSFVRQIELGSKNPTIESITYLCDALNISLHDFFNEETEETPKELIEILNIQLATLDSKQLKILIDTAKVFNE